MAINYQRFLSAFHFDIHSRTQDYKSSWRNRLARSTVNREVVGSIPTEDAYFLHDFYGLPSSFTVKRLDIIA